MSEGNRTLDLRICVAVLCLTLAGCEPPKQTGYVDQDIRREVFMECLKVVPAGPQHTKYNDWDDVVSECASAAYSIAQRGYRDTRTSEKVEKQ